MARIGDVACAALAVIAFAAVAASPAAATKVCTESVGSDGTNYTSQCVDTYPTGYVVENYGEEDKVCSSFLLLPAENLWSPGVRIFLYLFGLMYCFLGVAIIADVFMAGIEVITSKESKVERVNPTTGTKETVTIKVWHPTIANLSLMALGSSAPEVLLAVIGTAQTLDTTPDELGPSTIVGSASFNLMVIISICVVGLPAGEVRKFQDLRVFLTTAASSVLAYAWMAIVLLVWTPDEVSVAEALITFGCFPLLLFVAWRVSKLSERKAGQDEGSLGEGRIANVRVDTTEGGTGKKSSVGARDSPASPFERRRSVTDLVVEAEGREGDDDDLAAQIADEAVAEEVGQMSYARYRMNAVRGIGGKRRVVPPNLAEVRSRHEAEAQRLAAKQEQEMIRLDAARREAAAAAAAEAEGKASAEDVILDVTGAGSMDAPTVSFRTHAHAILESGGVLNVAVVRGGSLDKPCGVRVYTVDGTATEVEDYEKVDTVLTFEPGESEKIVPVVIVDDDIWEPDETFELVLESMPGAGESVAAKIGKVPRTEITILNDDNPGMLGFEQERYPTTEAAGELELEVVRKHGSDGPVSLEWSTSPQTAVEGVDFEGARGVLDFGPGETSGTISIKIINNHRDEPFEKTFTVVLQAPTPAGARLTRLRVATVAISQDEHFTGLVNKVASLIAARKEKYKIGSSSWAEQFYEAMSVYQEEDRDGNKLPPSTSDCVMHFLTIFWKVIFATVPPTDMMGGWLTFWVAIVYIGVLTAVVGELASLFGCAVGLPDSVTAITFVALGTSLPDTFASLQAAKMDKTADAAVGNVTGSNSANVFMGLGIPWCIGALYHAANGNLYTVPAGDLGFSVTVFTITAVAAIAIMIGRELWGGGVLGGATIPKYVTGGTLCSFWLVYIILSSMKAVGDLD
uniref:Calx-beta domain-containing protein n=1 Tax=Bicosoecida sp. CB-2014 TaxID=1486930 RepID=A0A7S1CBI4_9STRA